MKKLFVLAVLIGLQLRPAKASEGIVFMEGTFAEALAKCGEQHKLLFVDCYTTWCGPCKWMAAQVFTNDTVYKFFNENFICYKLDMEKGEGIDIAKKYSVKNYPTFLWIDGGGKQVHRSVGSAPAADFLTIAQHANHPQENLFYLDEQYKSGNKKPELLLQYAYALSTANDMNYQTVADEYFRAQPPTDLANESNWKIILDFTPNINSYVYNYIAENSDLYYKRYGKDSVQHVMNDLALQSLSYATQQKDSVMLEKAIARLKESGDKEMITEAAKGELDYYKRNKNMARYTALAKDYVPKYFFNDASMLNNICWTYFMRVDDKKQLADAEKWIAQSVKLDDKYYNTDTYANILHKMKKNKEAIEMAKHSIEMAKKSNEDYSSTEELLNSMLKN